MSVQNMISLLEQCILYNSHDFNPFNPLPKVTDASLNEVPSTASPHDADLILTKRDEAQETPPLNRLLSIDFDFSTPLAEGCSTLQSATPLRTSTRRRRKDWKSRPRRFRRAIQTPTSAQNNAESSAKVQASLISNNPKSQESNPKIAFLDLPAEIRVMVYNWLFCGARIHLSRKQGCRYALELHLGIRSSCKTIRFESAQPLFRNLTVHIYDYVQGSGCASLVDLIPQQIVSMIETVTVTTPTPGGLQVKMPDLQEMSSLRKFKLIHTQSHSVFTDEAEFSESVSSNHETKVASVFATPESHGDFWFTKWIQQKDRSLLVNYELEVWGQFVVDRAAHMGNLKKVDYRTLVFTRCSGEAQTVVKRELSLDQFRQRNEVYSKMRSSGIYIPSDSHPSLVLSRMNRMQYQEILNEIEAKTKGIGKPKMN